MTNATRDYTANFNGYRGNADESAAVETFYAVADAAGLTHADLTAEDLCPAAIEAHAAAIVAAWPDRIVRDPSFQGGH